VAFKSFKRIVHKFCSKSCVPSILCYKMDNREVNSVCERKCDFGVTMRRCLSDTRKMASFQRTVADFCHRTDSELLADIQRECHLVSPEVRRDCIRDLAGFRATRECHDYGLQRRVEQVSNVLSNPNPNPNPPIRRRRRGRGLLNALVLLFLLRGITRRRRRRFF